MADIHRKLAELLRPKLLVRAARHAKAHYNRTRHLPRLLGPMAQLSGVSAALKLAEMEAEIDQQRCAQDASYSAIRHIDVLTALMAEADLLARATVLIPKGRSAL
ncbi:MAG: DUF6477 family protein [Pseudomonadota bacterium]